METMSTSQPLGPQAAAEKAVSSLGCGFDLTNDVRLSRCKAPLKLIELDRCGGGNLHDLVIPGGVIVEGVPVCVRCDKGERTRFRSDILSFHQMARNFNLDLGLSGKVPSGQFNAMFDFRIGWRSDASSTKKVAFDGWFITLYHIELAKSQILLRESVKREVPLSWDPAALAQNRNRGARKESKKQEHEGRITRFIEKYGTHVITGIGMGGKEVFYLKQTHASPLEPSELRKILETLANEKFHEGKDENNDLDCSELSSGLMAQEESHLYCLRSPNIYTSKKDDVVVFCIRRGGFDCNQSHKQWLSSISMAPEAISLSLVPISSLLNGVPGSGFLIHAMNLYLRYKPWIEDLQLFLEFQLPRQWIPLFSEHPLGPQHNIQKIPCIQFALFGPKLQINTMQVNTENRPVTGIRLYLEGKRNDRMAIHLQHLSSLPSTFRIHESTSYNSYTDESHNRAYYEPVRWSFFSHICTAPIQYLGVPSEGSAAIVTKARLEVKDTGLKTVLFLRLGFSFVASSRIRRSEWDGSLSTRKSGSLTSFISSRFSSGIPTIKPLRGVEIDSAIFPDGPPVPVTEAKMTKYVNIMETTRGPEDSPGYWVVTGAKLYLDGGKISVRAKYSLLNAIPEDEM